MNTILRITSTIVVMAFLGLSSVSAQTTDEQYRSIPLQVIDLLQQQITALSLGTITTETGGTLVLPEGTSCGFRYTGDPSVISVQAELQAQGYAITKIDGIAGSETAAAVSAFQTAAGAAKVDGIVGAETRSLLSQHSLACLGDAGVSVGAVTLPPIAVDGCTIRYQGDESVIVVQQALQDQGYTITKVDGIAGPETIAAISAFETAAGLPVDGVIDADLRVELARRSLVCDAVVPLPSVPTTDPADQSGGEETTTTTTSTSSSTSVSKVEVVAGVRTTTAGVPDDTAVFTYTIAFTIDGVIYVPTNPSTAFDINVTNASGGSVNASSIDSIVTSAQKLVREDGSSYYLVKSGDTMSLRSSVQPGAGSYYATLARLSYTRDDAFTVQNPAMISYGFDDTTWRSETVSLLN